MAILSFFLFWSLLDKWIIVQPSDLIYISEGLSCSFSASTKLFYYKLEKNLKLPLDNKKAHVYNITYRDVADESEAV